MMKNKTIANQCLILALIVYIISVFYIDIHSSLNYIKAFSEAAIVGGIADWFAVTALFRHPFGIKIPHTAIIPNSKTKIGKNLSKFIRDNFLSEEYVRENLIKLNLKSKLIKALKDKKQNILKIFNRRLILIINKYYYEDLIDIIKPIVKEKINSLEMKNITINLLKKFQKEGYHHKSFMMILRTATIWLSVPENEKIINDSIKEIILKNNKSENSFFGRIKNYFIGEPKLNQYLKDFIISIETDTENKTLKRLDSILEGIYLELDNNLRFQSHLDNLKTSIINDIDIDLHLETIFKDIKKWTLSNLYDEKSALNKKIKLNYDLLINEVEYNTTFDKFIKNQVEFKIPQLMNNNIDFIDNYFVEYIENLDTKEMSSIIKDKVGDDLQFIRINGTIIGGFIGVILYTTTELITKL